MLVFNYNENWEKDNLEVNHIDCNRYNNNITNLEWCTRKENMEHAVAHNLICSGERKPNASLTDQQVHEICNILATQPRYKNQFADIGSKYGVDPIIILRIAYGISWRHISSQYNIDYNNKLNDRFTKEQVNTICKLLSDYGFYNDDVCRDICKTLGIEYNHSVQTRITRIHHRYPGYFKYITDLYEW